MYTHRRLGGSFALVAEGGLMYDSVRRLNYAGNGDRS